MNPELRRNLWIELSAGRLFAVPCVIALIAGIFILRDPSKWRAELFTTAVGIFVLMVHFLGTRNAAESVTEEVRDRTWDWQRLSSLGPWRMTWGKLAGAPAFSWYAGAICIVAIVVSAIGGTMRMTGWIVLLMMASAIMLHGSALAISLQASRKASRVGHRMGILLLLPLAIVCARLLTGSQDPSHSMIEWFGESWQTVPFAALSSLAFAAWAVFGAYREMCRELSLRTLPWAFPLFAVFVGIFTAGFVSPPATTVEASILMVLIASVAATYYALFADLTTAISLRRLALHARARQWRRAAEEIPLWAGTLALALLFAIAAAVLLDRKAGVEGAAWIGLYPIAIVLLVLRDCGILVYLALGPRPKRIDGTALLYILLLSGLVPGVLMAFSETLAAALMPLGRLNGVQAAMVFAVHVAIVWGAAWMRWRKLQDAYDGGAKS
ncbi:MAG: hypothetical protein ABIQ72_14525 [Usitatibacter sp.]